MTEEELEIRKLRARDLCMEFVLFLSNGKFSNTELTEMLKGLVLSLTNILYEIEEDKEKPVTVDIVRSITLKLFKGKYLK